MENYTYVYIISNVLFIQQFAGKTWLLLFITVCSHLLVNNETRNVAKFICFSFRVVNIELDDNLYCLK